MTTFDRAKLVGRWVYAVRDRSGGRVALRSTPQAQAPGRGRTVITLEAGGAAVIEHPGPDDRPVAARGVWSLSGATLSISAPGWSAVLTLESVEKDAINAREGP